MKRRDFSHIALSIGLSPILANRAVVQVAGQNKQAPPKNGVAEMSANDPMAAVRQYIDGFNKRDAKVMAATFAVPGSILDGMPPHVWQGARATQDWYRTCWLKVSNTALQIIWSLWASHCTITSPATAPTWSFQVRGKPVTQCGAVFTVALRKLTEEWRIAAWAWAKGTPR